MLAFPDPPSTLADATVALRLAAERDIPEVLIAHQDDPALAHRLGLARPPSGAELGRRAEDSAAERAGGRGLWLTVLARAGDRATLSDECRGQLEVREVDVENRRAALALWIAPAQRGRGLGSAALALAGRWLLVETRLERLQMLVDPAEPIIHRAAAKAGFRSEGVLRGYGAGGSLRRADVEVLSLVTADLPAPA